MTLDKCLSGLEVDRGGKVGKRVPPWRRRSLSSTCERLVKRTGGGLSKQLTGWTVSPAPNSCFEVDLRM